MRYGWTAALLAVAISGCSSGAAAGTPPPSSAPARVWQGFAAVAGVGDAAFAWYFEPQFRLTARSGNAYVVIRLSPDAATTVDPSQPLSP